MVARFFQHQIKPGILLGFCVLIWAGSSLRADSGLPDPYPSERYHLIWEKSPFSLPSAAPENQAGFAQNLALVGVIRIENEYYAAILDKISQKRELISRTPNNQGLKLFRIEPSRDLAKVSVTLQKGEESSTLRYDMDSLRNRTDTNPSPAVSSPNAGTPPPPSPSPRKGRIPLKSPPFPVSPSTLPAPQIQRPPRFIPNN